MNTPKSQLTKTQALEVFIYRDGNLYWRHSGKGRRMSKPAGGLCCDGYFRLGLNKLRYGVHNLVWNIHNGIIPDGYSVDHMDRNPANNDIRNLRIATAREQAFNRRPGSRNTSGHKNIHWHKKARKWQVHVHVAGKGVKKHIGLFSELEDAIIARDAATIALCSVTDLTLAQ